MPQAVSTLRRLIWTMVLMKQNPYDEWAMRPAPIIIFITVYFILLS